MEKSRTRRLLSFVLAANMLVSTINFADLMTVPVTAADTDAVVVTGTDESGFTYSSDGDSVTITGYPVNTTATQFYGIEYNGHYYGISSGKLTWTAAKTACENAGGYLVAINDAQEQAALNDMFTFFTSSSMHLGAYNDGGVWKWANGDSMEYSNWGSGHPMSFYESASVYFGSNPNGLWGTGQSSWSYNYVCEWEEKPSESVLALYTNHLEIPSEIDGLPVTAIADSAFKGKEYIVSVSIPDSVTSIGASAFEGCKYLKDVDLPDTITEIASSTFSDCVCLESIVIPDSVKSIGSYVFSGCDKLKNVDVPDTLSSIGSYAFEDCVSLTEAIIPAGTDRINDYAFYGCTGIKSVEIPSNIKAIYPRAFQRCSNLRELKLNEGLQVIGYYAFYDTLIQEVVIPSTVKTFLFSYYTNDAETTYANNNYVSYAAFSGARLKKVTFADGIKSIPYGALCDSKYLTTVVLPESVKSIGSRAFNGCDKLSSINIPSSVTSIGEMAFYCCYALEEVNLPDGLTSIGESAFASNWSLKTVSIPDSLTSIGQSVFRYNKSLEAVYIPDSVTSISLWAFGDCSSLTDVYFSGSQEQWDSITIGNDNEPLVNATLHCAHEHTYGEWVTDRETTCALEGSKHRTCSVCGYNDIVSIDKVAHTYESEIVEPTYLEQGYTRHVCSVCGDSYNDEYVDALERTDITEATLELEYTEVYYEGSPLKPTVTITYDGQTYDSAKELKLTYKDNNKVGTATVTVEGINKFTGTVELQFNILYEEIPDKIVNVNSIGEIGKISLSWGQSSEVNTTIYKVYRKAEDETEFTLIKTIAGRHNLSYEDTSVEKEKSYSYYVTGVGLYGAEGEPSEITTATALVDVTAPVILKITPTSASTISGEVTLSAVVTDNVGVEKVVYYYSVNDSGVWMKIGESKNGSCNVTFDSSELVETAVKVKAVAYDAQGNESEPVVVAYSLDNEGPDKVTGLFATALSSKITLSWNDVGAKDAKAFILQTKVDGTWKTVSSTITTLGYNVSGLVPGTEYVYRVACIDTRGNIGEYSDECSVTTLADNTAPVIVAQGPASARFNETIEFYVTAKDDSDIQSIRIQTSTDGVLWTDISTKEYTSRLSTQTYSYIVNLDEFEEGRLYLRGVATDFAGNESSRESTAPYSEYIIDRTAPEAPTNVAAKGNDGYITVSWDMGNESDIGKYFVYRSETEDGIYQLVASNLSTLNYHDRDVLSDKTMYYKVRVSDSCGNMSAYSEMVSSTVLEDTTSPEIIGLSATYQQKISNKINTIDVSASDNNKLYSIVVEYCTADEPDYVLLTSEDNINSSYKSLSVKLPTELLEDGDGIYVRVCATDVSGNASAYTVKKYTMDTTPPLATDFTATLDAQTVYLDWTAVETSDLSGFMVYRSEDGINFTKLGSRGVNSTGEYSFVDTISADETKTYIYKLETLDKLGNSSSVLQSVEYTYVYINEIPVPKIEGPSLMMLDVEERFDASASTDDISIESYLWDFGDGTTSTEVKPVKSYSWTGTFTVTLSVTDNEGITAVMSKEIEVKERDSFGTLKVKVVDDSDKVLSYVPVYFDLGSDNQKVIYTNLNGEATLNLLSGTHTIGMYVDGYLPVKKDVVVLANATRTVTLKTVQDELVVGNFEVTRMTFDEIVAAGIDVSDPANLNVYSGSVRVTYAETLLNSFRLDYVRNDSRIVEYTICNANGEESVDGTYVDKSGSKRKITDVSCVEVDGKEIIAVLDIPVEASYLKEFFDVKLHIINNASSDFSIENSTVELNVPDGLSLATAIDSVYSNSNKVSLGTIKGQEIKTISWVIRGDEEGEYDLSADFSGTLADFDEAVTARFETNEPIKVYGMSGVKLNVLLPSEIRNQTLYFNLEIENERDIDVAVPTIGILDKIANVTDIINSDDSQGEVYNAPASIINAYIQTGEGKRQYFAVDYDSNGDYVVPINALAPGQKLVFEYVVYNAINYDGIASFDDAVATVFQGEHDSINVSVFNKERYSMQDYSTKLDNILNGDNPIINDAYKCIIGTDMDYYHEFEALDLEDDAVYKVYAAGKLVFKGDTNYITNDFKKEYIRHSILTLLAELSVAEQVENMAIEKTDQAVTEMLDEMERNAITFYAEQGLDEGEISRIFDSITQDSDDLVEMYRKEGSNELKNYVVSTIKKKVDGKFRVITLENILGNKDEAKILSKHIGITKKTLSVIFDASEAAERDYCFYALLKYHCNTEISKQFLKQLIEHTYICYDSVGYNSMIRDVAQEMLDDLEEETNKYYEEIRTVVNAAELSGGRLAYAGFSNLMKKAAGGTAASVIGVSFNLIDYVFGWGNYYEMQNTMCTQFALAELFISAFYTCSATRSEENDRMAMLFLKSACECRLIGEREYKAFVDACFEENALLVHNQYKGTNYESTEEWYDEQQEKILRARDILFNTEGTSSIAIPSAPSVTLNYDTLRTYQYFDSSYEYCLADGVWKTCDGYISFEVGETPSTLRVRVKAGDNNAAGEITTVRIYAKRDISKQITVKFDGVNYIVDNLSANRTYQILFTDDASATPDWTESTKIVGSETSVKISGVSEFDYVVIRSCTNHELYETASNPLKITVSKKMPLDLKINGSGKVTQTSSSGCYFAGEDVNLMAVPNSTSEFTGWYVNGDLVSTDKEYVVEMAEDLTVEAQFTGVKIAGITIEELPTKLTYYEGESLDFGGMKVLVTYADGTSEYAQEFTSQLTSNVAGDAKVVITYGGYTTSYDVTIEHKLNDWITTIEPTLFNEGLKVHTCSCCRNIVESEVLPMLVDDSGIIIDNEEHIIYNFPEEMFDSDVFVEHYDELGCKVTVTDSQDNNSELVMTGGYVVYRGTKYTAIVLGDTTGDGEIDIFDILSMIDHLNNQVMLEGVYEKAGLIVNEEEIDIFDILAVIDYVNGVISIHPQS